VTAQKQFPDTVLLLQDFPTSKQGSFVVRSVISFTGNKFILISPEHLVTYYQTASVQLETGRLTEQAASLKTS
jgi:hypothetical protein